MDLFQIIQIFEQNELQSFFEKYEINHHSILTFDQFQQKDLYRHYLYFMVLEKRLHTYSFDSFSEKEIQDFLEKNHIFHSLLLH
jgi:hypothetical protein